MTKWNINDIKPGDRIFVMQSTMIGWKTFRYPIYQEYTVSRITPKKTKIYVEESDEEFPTAKIAFYKDSPELQRQNQIALYAAKCSQLIYRVDRYKNNIHCMTDDEIIKLHDNLTEISQIIEKYNQSH